jgi:Protein of unknown function (DUF2785)
MNRSFWQQILATDCALPSDPEIRFDDLTDELVSYLSSPDPQLRDEFGFTILATWIASGALSEQQRAKLMSTCRGNMFTAVGQVADDSVFGRSFSVLTLAAILEREKLQPFLHAAEIKELLDHCLLYVHAEKDLRGYIVGKGWAHSVAHTADALGSLAANPHVTSEGLQRILEAIGNKLTTPNSPAFQHHEASRLALAAKVAILRGQLSHERLVTWVADILITLGSTAQSDLEAGDVGKRVNCESFMASLYLQLQSVDFSEFAELREELRHCLEQFGFVPR